MDRVTGNNFHLKFWHPLTREEVGREVTSIDEVRQQVEVAFEMYRSAGVDYLAGIAVWSDPDDPANSLTICAGPQGYALVHTDTDYLQTVSDSGQPGDGTRHRVQLDDFVEVPDRSFLPKLAALDIVEAWMGTGQLPPPAVFTADLFG